jgi:Sulfotransferase domain
MALPWRTWVRESIAVPARLLPGERSVAVERWLRGREDLRRLTSSDYVVVSYGNSGRTWLRFLLSRVYQLQYRLPEHDLISFDNFRSKNAAIPAIHFTHDNYLGDYTKHRGSKEDYLDKRVVLLVRHPADVAVSQYFQWRHRMRRRKKELNRYPTVPVLSLYDFLMRHDSGLPRIIRFLNTWAQELPRMRSVLVLRYEDLRSAPEATFERVLRYLGVEATPELIQGALAFASVDNMRRLEDRGSPFLRTGRFHRKDPNDSQAYKARRARAGGYREDFSEPQLAVIDALIEAELSSVFDYAAGPYGRGSIGPR